MTAPAGQVVCANCGRMFDGRFCPDCGQDLEDVRRPFAEITRDFLGDFFAFDARLWRTLVPLFTRPGRLTVDYVEGRRARYVPPLKLYVFAGFLYFTITALIGGGPFTPVITNENGSINFGFAGFSSNRPDPAERAPLSKSSAAHPDSTVGGIALRLQERGERAAEDPEAFARAINATLSWAHFLLLPILALILKALYRKRYYAEHLVFGMHFHAFALFPAVAIAVLFETFSLDLEGWVAGAAQGVWTLVLPAYLGIALHRAYGGGTVRTLVKLGVLGATYALVAAIVIFFVSILALWTF